jgi:sugar lactone lactonase YvrE
MGLEIAARTDDSLGEGVIWNPDEQALYWVDAFAPAIHRLDTTDGDVSSWEMPEIIGSLVFDRHGTIVAGLESGYCRVSLDPLTLDPIVNPQPAPGIIFNDGKCDRRGRYFIGTMHREFSPDAGILWRLDADLSCHQVDTGITVSNGLAWSPDDSIMYFADTRRDVVYAYDYDIDTGDASNRRTFISTTDRPGRVDGATVDQEGNYWAALIHEGAVGCFSPSGEEVRRIDLPVSHPTMCTFGGENLDQLYIVTSQRFLDEAGLQEEPLAGSLFVVDGLGVSGIAEPFFAG